jgi:hypothetical protein
MNISSPPTFHSSNNECISVLVAKHWLGSCILFFPGSQVHLPTLYNFYAASLGPDQDSFLVSRRSFYRLLGDMVSDWCFDQGPWQGDLATPPPHLIPTAVRRQKGRFYTNLAFIPERFCEGHSPQMWNSTFWPLLQDQLKLLNSTEVVNRMIFRQCQHLRLSPGSPVFLPVENMCSSSPGALDEPS